MVRDLPRQVINESIRRLIDQTMDEAIVEKLPECPIWRAMNPERVKRLVAMNVVMARITQSARWN